MTVNPKIYKWLSDSSSRVFKGSHSIHTPKNLVDDIISNIDLDDKDFLVLYNIEFAIALVDTFNVSPERITFFSDHENKSQIATDLLGIKYIMALEEYTKKKPVLLINPPYTNGERDASEIYTQIIDRVIEQVDPIAIGAVTPENLINGGQKKKTLREKLLSKYGLKYVAFLNQSRDWHGAIEIDTICFVAQEGYSADTTVNGRYLNETYSLDMKALGLTALANGETQDIHDWMISIQTKENVPLKSSKKTDRKGKQAKISKTEVDSLSIEDGLEYISDNTTWRVAFGYMRGNTCAVVPPGISIPSKYRYVVFKDESSARKFRDFMLCEPIRFIMKMTYTSRTLDAPQMKYIPWIDLNQFASIDDATLYAHWNTSSDAQLKINGIVGQEVPF